MSTMASIGAVNATPTPRRSLFVGDESAEDMVVVLYSLLFLLLFEVVGLVLFPDLCRRPRHRDYPDPTAAVDNQESRIFLKIK